MRRYVVVLVSLLLGAFLVAPPASAHPHPYCGIWWGSLPKQAGPGTSELGDVTNVRTGRHACFDRVVIDVNGPNPGGYFVEYVDGLVTEGGGFPVSVRGGARLQVTALVPAYDDNGDPTYLPADTTELRDVTGYRTLRQLVSLGSFEGQTSIGVGVRGRLPFRVFTLAGPGGGSRIVVDVAHRW